MSANEQEKVFLEVYDQYADPIFRHCFFRLHDREKAKDAVQEVFLRLWRYMAKEKIDNVRPFLYQIANNLIIDEWRKRKNDSLDELLEAGYEFADTTIPNIDFSVEGHDIMDMLRSLSDKDQDILVMRYVDDLAVSQIAELIGETENVVYVRIHRAIKKLRDKFAQNEADV